jgi:formylglycine-generating enzyme required for sulfatase activity
MMRIRNKLILNGVFYLLLAGIACAAEAQVASQPADDGMVLIPAGEFIMGSNKEEDTAMERDANALNPFGFKDRLYIDEHPAHKVTLPAFRMDKYEVTNSQYLDFVTATKHNTPLAWKQNGYNLTDEFLGSLPVTLLRRIASDKFNLDMDVPNASQEELLAEMKKVRRALDKLPVTRVTWFDARDFCAWAGKRLPTEAEWEKAARGPDGFEYPWGNDWDLKRINTMSQNSDQPYSDVGSNPGDVSPYGVYDMAGNVEEWVMDWYDAYPGATSSTNKLYGKVQRVARGGMTGAGHYDSLSLTFRSAKRNHWEPDSSWIDLGFRCVKDVN